MTRFRGSGAPGPCARRRESDRWKPQGEAPRSPDARAEILPEAGSCWNPSSLGSQQERRVGPCTQHPALSTQVVEPSTHRSPRHCCGSHPPSLSPLSPGARGLQPPDLLSTCIFFKKRFCFFQVISIPSVGLFDSMGATKPPPPSLKTTSLATTPPLHWPSVDPALRQHCAHPAPPLLSLSSLDTESLCGPAGPSQPAPCVLCDSCNIPDSDPLL